MLSKRLESLIKYIDKNDKLIDIGCDHGLIDIYLVKNKIINSVIISDIHEGALKAGKENVTKHHLEKQIDARLGNGLEVLKQDEVIDTVLISGMGTSTILKILNNNYLKNINKLILQSNNNHEELRKEVVKLGFIITDEEYFIDNKKNYINIVFKRGNQKYKRDELRYGPILIKNKAYLNFELENCLKIKNLIKNPKLKQKISLNHEINKIKKYIKRVNI
ncbi:MAG: SAM-dependent methyltransferase [Bacilli bacterium]|jgi:tRNA (adenine22-N1)-methyltransferase|nr:SAM-dependent methyltransferase [Bacilli bacterium]